MVEINSEDAELLRRIGKRLTDIEAETTHPYEAEDSLHWAE